MSKISLLPVLDTQDVDGTETLPVIKGGENRQVAASPLIEALAQPSLDKAANSAAIAEAAADIDLFDTVEDGEAATPSGERFGVRTATPGIVEVYLRTAGGSEFVRTVVSGEALGDERGSSNIGFVQAGNDAAPSTIEAILRRPSICILDFYKPAEHAGDYLPAFANAIARLKELGGGELWCPYVGGYEFSYTPVVDGSNITVRVDDPSWKVTATAVLAGQPLNAIKFSGTLGSRISNVALVCTSETIFDGNGSNIQGYTYTTGSTGVHFAVYFAHCEKIFLQNVTGYNGLVGGISTYNAYGGTMVQCKGSTPIYDNGIYIYPTLDFDPDDKSTWANILLIGCTGEYCRNHGLGFFGAVGTIWVSPRVYKCGNNTPVSGAAGPPGGFGCEHNNADDIDDYHCSVTDLIVIDSWGYGLRTNANGVTVRGGKISGVKVPTAYDGSVPGTPTDTENAWGSAIFSQNVFLDAEIDIELSGKWALRAKGTSGVAPAGIRYKGKITRCRQNAIYGNGIDLLDIDLTAGCNENGDATQTANADAYYTAFVDNTNAYPGTGKLKFKGDFNENGSGLLRVKAIGHVQIDGVKGANNGKHWAAAYHAVYITDTDVVEAANIRLRDENGKIARIGVFGNVVVAEVDHASIAGDQTATNKPFIEFTGVAPATHRGSPPSRAVALAFGGSVTPDSARGAHVYGAMTDDMALAADTPTAPPMDGQLLVFEFLQDGAGGRSVAWDPAWFGASLTSAGTAGQRARVGFVHLNGRWTQTFNTGWLS